MVSAFPSAALASSMAACAGGVDAVDVGMGDVDGGGDTVGVGGMEPPLLLPMEEFELRAEAPAEQAGTGGEEPRGGEEETDEPVTGEEVDGDGED